MFILGFDYAIRLSVLRNIKTEVGQQSLTWSVFIHLFFLSKANSYVSSCIVVLFIVFPFYHRQWTSGRYWWWMTNTQSAAIYCTSCSAGAHLLWSSWCWSLSCLVAMPGISTASMGWYMKMCKYQRAELPKGKLLVVSLVLLLSFSGIKHDNPNTTMKYSDLLHVSWEKSSLNISWKIQVVLGEFSHFRFIVHISVFLWEVTLWSTTSHYADIRCVITKYYFFLTQFSHSQKVEFTFLLAWLQNNRNIMLMRINSLD